jgi:hypothetical protein
MCTQVAAARMAKCVPKGPTAGAYSDQMMMSTRQES